jgi:hypothetical protein
MEVSRVLDIGTTMVPGIQFLKAIFTVLCDDLALNLEERPMRESYVWVGVPSYR